MRKKFHPVVIHAGRWTWYVSAALLVILALIYTLARLWLPTLSERKAEIEEYLSSKSVHRVSIEKLDTYWDGLYPGLHLQGLRVYSRDGRRPAIALDEVRVTLALLPLLWGKLEIGNLILVRPALAFERQADGSFRITGFDPVRPAEAGEAGGFMKWVFLQRNLVIEGGRFQWSDHLSGEKALYLSEVNISLQNSGDHHRLGLDARFPEKICRECSLVVDITGNPLETREWGGRIFLQAVDMDIGALPMIVREKLRPGVKGKFSVQAQSHWRQGMPTQLSGQVEATALDIPLGGKVPLSVRKAAADLKWKGGKEEWKLQLRNLTVGLHDAPWTAGNLVIEREPGETLLQIQHVNLSDISKFIENLEQENKFIQLLRALRPRGTADKLSLQLEGDAMAPDDFMLQANIAGLKVQPYKKFPGVTGLNGSLAMSRLAGDFRLNTRETRVTLPQVFREPFMVGHASGSFHWEKEADYWNVEGKDLFASSKDGRGRGNLLVRVPVDRSLSPFLKLQAEFSDGNGAHAARYYPVNVLRESTIEWLENFIVSGTITRGQLSYEGNIREFPFRDGNGSFEVRARVTNGVLNYLPGWAPIEGAEVDILSNGRKFLVTGDKARIRRLDLSRVVVRADDLHRGGGNKVNISGVISGPVNDTLAVLRESQPEKGEQEWKEYIPRALQAEGDGVLSLGLVIPVDDPKAVKMSGEYSFQESSLMLPNIGVRADRTKGAVSFTEKGVSRGNLQAKYLGSDVVVGITSAEKDGMREVQARAAGAWTATGLAQAYGSHLGAYLNGDAEWNGSARFYQGRLETHIESNLKRIGINLPPPLDRPQGVNGKLVLNTISSDPNEHLLGMTIGDQVQGQFAFAREEDEGWAFTAGHIAFGGQAALTPGREGLHISARAAYLNADSWLKLFRGKDGEEEWVPAFVTHLSGDFFSLDLFDRNFGRVNIDVAREKKTWAGSLAGDMVEGRGTFSVAGKTPSIELKLQRLILPEVKKKTDEADPDPRTLPAVVIESQSFQFGNKNLGALEFRARPKANGWRIDQLNFLRAEMRLLISGEWLLDKGGHRSRFDIDFNSSDMGKTMSSFGNPDQMDGGKAEFKAKLSWGDVPTRPGFAKMDGHVGILASDGRFLQVKQGAGRFLGVLDLSSIARYLSLDFTTLFGKGFVYNKIDGEVNINNGNATFEGLLVKGPSAQLKFSGRVGFAAEDYDLEMWVYPRLRESLTVTSWTLWGPQAAAVVLALQKIFKKKITKGTRIGYVITGPWKDPVVTRVTREIENGKPEPAD